MGKFCTKCGNEVNSNQDVCINCGHQLRKEPPHIEAEGDTLGWAILGFLIPIAGLILYLVWQQERPKAANSAGKGALISVVFSAVFFAFLVTVAMSNY